MTSEEIAELFREMEDELFKSMARNLKRHEAWEEDEGFTWVQWQAEQINSLRAFREEIQDIVNATYNEASPQMEKLLKDAYHYAGEKAAIDLRKSTRRNVSQQFFGVTPKMRGLIDNVMNDIERTRYAAINRMNSGYTSIIQKADIWAQSGSMTIPQAVDKASAEFVSSGLNCVEYKNGHRVGIDSYVEMALRTSSRDAAATAEGEKRDEWGEYLVVSNVINTTCPHCMKWQGKVLVDDVYAHGKADGKHKMLSVAKEDGFLHPNCRHKPRTYIPGVTKVADQPEKAKTKEQYEAEQKQRYYERNIRKYKRLSECSLDADNKAHYDRKIKEWSDALDEHLEANPSLRKNPWRESKRGNVNYRNEREKNIFVDGYSNKVDLDYIGSQDYRDKFDKVSKDSKVNDDIYNHSKEMLEHRNGTDYEDLVLLDYDTGELITKYTESKEKFGIGKYPQYVEESIKNAKENGKRILAIHNHPNGYPPNADDLSNATRRGYYKGITVGHNGSLFTYLPSPEELSDKELQDIHGDVLSEIDLTKSFDEISRVWLNVLKKYSLSIRRHA